MMTSKDVMAACKYNCWIAMHAVWELLNQNEWRFISHYNFNSNIVVIPTTKTVTSNFIDEYTLYNRRIRLSNSIGDMKLVLPLCSCYRRGKGVINYVVQGVSTVICFRISQKLTTTSHRKILWDISGFDLGEKWKQLNYQVTRNFQKRQTSCILKKWERIWNF